jgi:hypothetical protein
MENIVVSLHALFGISLTADIALHLLRTRKSSSLTFTCYLVIYIIFSSIITTSI